MQVNGEAQNLTPHHAQTLYAGIIKIGRGDYVVDPYTYAKVQGRLLHINDGANAPWKK